MRKTLSLILIATGAAAGLQDCVGATAAPVAKQARSTNIGLRQSGRIRAALDARVCIELRVSRRARNRDEDYRFGRLLSGARTGIYEIMQGRRVATELPGGAPRVVEIGDVYSLPEECPDRSRDLVMILHLTAPRSSPGYHILAELHQGGSLFSVGVDRRAQRLPRTPDVTNRPDAQGYVTDGVPPPWTAESDARLLAMQLARLVRWETER